MINHTGQSHQTNKHFVLKLRSFNNGKLITTQQAGNYKTAGNYKITSLTVQCRLQSIVWLHLKFLTGKLKKQNADLHSRFLYWNILCNLEYFKSIGKLNFVIKDVHITQKMDCVILLRFLHLACFAVSTCVISVSVYWVLMAYAGSITYSFTRLQKTISSCRQRRNDHMKESK